MFSCQAGPETGLTVTAFTVAQRPVTSDFHIGTLTSEHRSKSRLVSPSAIQVACRTVLKIRHSSASCRPPSGTCAIPFPQALIGKRHQFARLAQHSVADRTRIGTPENTGDASSNPAHRSPIGQFAVSVPVTVAAARRLRYVFHSRASRPRNVRGGHAPRESPTRIPTSGTGERKC